MTENTSTEGHPTHLSPSELGTKEYWETFYSRTLTHISSKRDATTTETSSAAEPKDSQDQNSDSGDEEDDYNGDSDPGTSWFSEHNAPQKILSFLTDESFPLAPVNTLPSSTSTPSQKKRRKGTPLPPSEKEKQPSILDLGTGNGSMLALLRKRGGFAGDMVGVDYSQKSVELARELQDKRGHEAYQTDSEGEDDESDFGDEDAKDEPADEESKWDPIAFEEWDILSPSTTESLTQKLIPWFPYKTGGFYIVLDKGTFDAISLMAEKDGTERYPSIAGGLVRRGGFLVVTSCNWTEEEVVRWFTRDEVVDLGLDENGPSKLVVWGRVQYPRFRFGGQEGQGVCTVCFQRV
ncbi:hypothetical protein BDV06DRAFT_232572 [Aspergillus oleicola]